MFIFQLTVFLLSEKFVIEEGVGMKAVYHLLIAVICLLLMLGSAVLTGAEEELPAGIVIVVAVSGSVTYQNELTQQVPAQVHAFMKLCQDDVVKLPVQSQITLTYLKGGRQETWQGQIVLKIGAKESAIQSSLASSPQPQVKDLPEEISRVIRETVLPFPKMKIERVAGANVRQLVIQPQPEPTTPPTLIESEQERLAIIKTAKDTYAKLKAQRGKDDLTPELYLLSVFADYEQYGEMKTMVEELLQTYPDNPMLQRWKSWVQQKS
jgi:hypothetical protein